MRGVPADGGITVSGVKKPCSLTWSMNLMSASVAVTDPATGTDRLAVVLIPGLPPTVTHRRRRPHCPLPRRRPADPLML